MKNKIKNILEGSFYQLILIYFIILLAIAIGLFWKYSLQFHIFAFALAIMGTIFVKNNNNSKIKLNKKTHYIFLTLALLLILSTHILPYIDNSIPLGYDPGIYKYGIEHGLENLDGWILKGGIEPGFLYLSNFLNLFISTNIILTGVLVGFCALLGISIYLLTKELFNKETGLIALFLFAFSIIQFKAFWFNYYKNILGIIMILFAFLFLIKFQKSRKRKFIFLFILTGGILGSIHRPSFYIFGLSYFFYTFIKPWQDENFKKYNLKSMRNNIFYGILILLIAISFYIGNWREAILIMFEPVLQGFIAPGESPGTFIDFFTYQYSSLIYLPLALFGLFKLIKKKDFNILTIWAIINLSIVYFQFFFYNRFIIFLDVILIIMASLGLYTIINNRKKTGAIILIILSISASIFITQEALDSKPLIDESELTSIEYLQNTPENSFVMSTSAHYSPWVLGYSERKTIAPGLFDYNLHNKKEWAKFWSAKNISEIKSFMDDYKNEYSEEIYVFIGKNQKNFISNFDTCFERYYASSDNIIYKYSC